MAYLLDADVFIRAKNLHYGLDFCPAFRDWLITQNGAGVVFSIEKVGDGVQAVDDELSVLASARGDAFFLKPDAAVFPALAVEQVEHVAHLQAQYRHRMAGGGLGQRDFRAGREGQIAVQARSGKARR